MEGTEFRNISELVGHLRTKLNNLHPAEALDALQEIVGRDISVKYEIVPTPQQPTQTPPQQQPTQTPQQQPTQTQQQTQPTQTQQQTQPTQQQQQQPQQPPALKHNRFAHVAGQRLSRILLSTNKKYGDLTSELARQLNGMVLQYPGWKVLSVPSPMLNYKFKQSDVVKNLSNYDIFPVVDGTVVTLYWYDVENKWKLSTTNGYDVTDFKWLTSKTYFEAFMELAAGYPEFSLARLDTNCCYTIGIRHHDFQPLLADPQRIWFIRSCNVSLLNNITVIRANIAALMSQPANIIQSSKNNVPILVTTTNVDIGLPIQTPIIFPPEASATNIFNSMLDKNEKSVEEFTKTGDIRPLPHYGYFLRPKVQRVDLCDILIESPVLSMIRKSLYNFPKKRHTGETELTHENRIEYATLRAYLSNKLKYPFIMFYPQYAPLYKKYDSIFNRVAARIVALAKKNPGDKKPVDKIVETIAQRFYDNLKKQGINILNADGLGIAMDTVIDRRYLEMYFTLFINNQ
jgi:hypothetical protein